MSWLSAVKNVQLPRGSADEEWAKAAFDRSYDGPISSKSQRDTAAKGAAIAKPKSHTEKPDRPTWAQRALYGDNYDGTTITPGSRKSGHENTTVPKPPIPNSGQNEKNAAQNRRLQAVRRQRDSDNAHVDSTRDAEEVTKPTLSPSGTAVANYLDGTGPEPTIGQLNRIGDEEMSVIRAKYRDKEKFEDIENRWKGVRGAVGYLGGHLDKRSISREQALALTKEDLIELKNLPNSEKKISEIEKLREENAAESASTDATESTSSTGKENSTAQRIAGYVANGEVQLKTSDVMALGESNLQQLKGIRDGRNDGAGKRAGLLLVRHASILAARDFLTDVREKLGSDDLAGLAEFDYMSLLSSYSDSTHIDKFKRLYREKTGKTRRFNFKGKTS